jgi:hypothetical protein
MRLFEIFQPPSEIYFSNTFKTQFDDATKSRPILLNKLKYFLTAKLGNIVLEDDKPFTGNQDLKKDRYRKWPLETGKLIIIYKVDELKLKLYMIVTHREYDTAKAATLLFTKLEKFSDEDFTLFDFETFFNKEENEEEDKSLQETLREFLDNAVYQLISTDSFDVLKPAIENNDWDFLIEWFNLELNDINNEKIKNVTLNDIFLAYGGSDELKQFIIDSIKQYGKIEEYNKQNY